MKFRGGREEGKERERESALESSFWMAEMIAVYHTLGSLIFFQMGPNTWIKLLPKENGAIIVLLLHPVCFLVC